MNFNFELKDTFFRIQNIIIVKEDFHINSIKYINF